MSLRRTTAWYRNHTCVDTVFSVVEAFLCGRQTRPASDGERPLLESMRKCAVPADREISCSSGAAGSGDFPFLVLCTVHERRSRRLRGSAARREEHEPSAPPFFSASRCDSIQAQRRRKRGCVSFFKAISVPVSARCYFPVSANESRSCLSESRLVPGGCGCCSTFRPPVQVLLSWNKSHFGCAANRPPRLRGVTARPQKPVYFKPNVVFADVSAFGRDVLYKDK